MKAPSLVIGFKGEVPSVIYCGEDAGKAKSVYEASNGNADLDGVMLFIRPPYARRNRPAKHVEVPKAKVEAPKRKADK